MNEKSEKIKYTEQDNIQTNEATKGEIRQKTMLSHVTRKASAMVLKP